MSDNPRPPAFPQSQCSQCGIEHAAHIPEDEGMTLRDYFAAKAMESLITDRLQSGAADLEPAGYGAYVRAFGWDHPLRDFVTADDKPATAASLMASDAYAIADAMLVERDRTTEGV